MTSGRHRETDGEAELEQLLERLDKTLTEALREQAGGEAELEQFLEQVDEALTEADRAQPIERWWVAWAQSPEDLRDLLEERAQLWWEARGPLLRDLVAVAYRLVTGPRRLPPAVALQQ